MERWKQLANEFDKQAYNLAFITLENVNSIVKHWKGEVITPATAMHLLDEKMSDFHEEFEDMVEKELAEIKKAD